MKISLKLLILLKLLFASFQKVSIFSKRTILARSLLLLGVAVFCISLFFYSHSKRSHFFNPSFILYDQNLWPIYETDPLTTVERDRLKTILSQPFTFLGSGNQTFAFESQDGHYVLKFFKFQHLKEQSFLSWLPLPAIKEKIAQSKARRIEQVFLGHFIATAYDKEQSGIHYVHLNPQEKTHLKANIVDYAGLKYQIDLDEVVFVLQKKGESSRKAISKLLDRGQVKKACELLQRLLALYVDDYRRGVFDRDHNIMHNTGFINSTPMRIDVGKLKMDNRMKEFSNFKHDLKKITSERIVKWVKNYYPFYRKIIDEHLQLFIQTLEQEPYEYT